MQVVLNIQEVPESLARVFRASLWDLLLKVCDKCVLRQTSGDQALRDQPSLLDGLEDAAGKNATAPETEERSDRCAHQVLQLRLNHTARIL